MTKKEELKKEMTTVNGTMEYWLTTNSFNELVKEGTTKIQLIDDEVLQITLKDGDVIDIRMSGEKVISTEFEMAKVQLMKFSDIYDVNRIIGERGCKIL